MLEIFMTSRNCIKNFVIRYRAFIKKYRFFTLLSITLFSGTLVLVNAQPAFSEDITLEQKNIHFLDYSKEYDGNLTINITATGRFSDNTQNFDDEDFRPNEGTFGSNHKQYGTGVLIWNKSSLDVAENLSITIAPERISGSKWDITREGIDMKNGGVMSVGGNTTILVDNYLHTSTNPPAADNEDYGLNSQKGISMTGTGTDLDIKGDLAVTMLNGNRSMGILVNDNADLTVDGNTSITVRNAPYYTYGIGNYYSDQNYGLGARTNDGRLHFKKDLAIVTEGGNNSIGINLKDGNRNSAGEQSITVDGHLSIHASGAEKYENRTSLQTFPNAVSNYGMYMYYIADSLFNTADITTIAEGDAESIGSYLYWYSNAAFRGDVTYHTEADPGAVSISALARAGSSIDFQQGLIADGSIVLNAVGNTSGKGSTILVNSSENPDAVVQLTGNIVAGKTSTAYIFGSNYDTTVDADETLNTITAHLLNDKSFFTGINEFGNKGSKIDLTFNNGARWNMTGSSPVSNLVVSRGGIVDMTYDNAQAASGFRTLTAETLSGEGGIFNVNTDIENDLTDQIIIGRGTGNHGVYVNPTGADPSREAMNAFIVQQQSGDGTFSLANECEVNGSTQHLVEQGNYFYALAQRDGSATPDTQEWYLKRTSIEQPDPDKPGTPSRPETPTGETEAALSSLAGHYALWYGQLTDLRKRLGEVRYGTQTGLWVRGFADKSRLDGFAGYGFTQHLTGGSLGYDRAVSTNEDHLWILGMQIRSGHADQRVQERWGGFGDLNSVGAGFYSTWLHVDGWYLDAVTAMDWYEHEIRTAMLNGVKVHDDRSSYGVGASLEGGRRMDFAFSNNGLNSWFVEPQVQLAWFWVRGGEFGTSNGMTIEQSDMNTLTGRAGVVLGKKFALKGSNGERYMQPYVKVGVNHEFLGEQKARINDLHLNSEMEGTRVYYGLGADWQATDNLRLYVQAEREHGEHFTREYNVSAGLKWRF